VQRSPALEAVSTASLDALRKYADGNRATDVEGDLPKAIGLLKEAVAIDSTFAMAWRKLAVAYGNNGFDELQDSAIVHALRFRDRLTERERNNVVGYYYGSGPGRDRAKAAEAYEALVAAGNVDAGATNLANIYRNRGEYARAESLYRRRIAVGGAAFVTHANLIDLLVRQGKIGQADSALEAIVRQFPNVAGVKTLATSAMYLRGRIDSAKALFEAEFKSRNAGTRGYAYDGVAAIEGMRGRLAESNRLRLTQRAIDSARGVPVNPLGPVFDSSRSDVWYFQRFAAALARLDAGLARYPLRALPVNRRPYFNIANLYAMAGKPERARAMLAQYDAEQRDTSIRRSEINGRKGVESEILLAEGRPQDAIAAYRASTMLPDGPVNSCDACDDAGLGRLFDKAGMADSAIVYYEQFLASRFAGRLFVDAGWLGPTRKRLGELYEQRGDREKAAKVYSDFVEQWKNADAELQPQVTEVRRRLSRLADIEKKP
jgi:tetratricopeptide (TPR) repeat protein